MKGALVANAVTPLSLVKSIPTDLYLTGLTLAIAYAWVNLCVYAVEKKYIDSTLCRKVIHITGGPICLLFWPLYSTNKISSRLWASIVPLFQIYRLVSSAVTLNLKDLKDFAKKLKKIDKQDAKQDAKQVAKRGAKRGAKRDQKKNKNDKSEKIELRKFSFPKFGLANSVSRSGKREEALGSPLIYLIVLTLNTLLFFRDSPVGAVVICQMAVGDGLSDVIGRRYPIKSWKFAPSKSIGGTLAFVVGAFVTTALALALLNDTDCINLYVPYYIPQILLISVLCAAVELTPFTDDNISVPTVAALAGMALF